MICLQVKKDLVHVIFTYQATVSAKHVLQKRFSEDTSSCFFGPPAERTKSTRVPDKKTLEKLLQNNFNKYKQVCFRYLGFCSICVVSGK